jgi:DNA invertase Pin-like site-specific DNA recombinase
VVIVDEEELAGWKEYFSLYGTRSEIFRSANVNNTTLTRILKDAKGEERIIQAIRKHVKKQAA